MTVVNLNTTGTNITQVNLTITPSNITIVSNGTTTNISFYYNTSNMLGFNITNLSLGVTNQTIGYFWFNASASLIGNFTVNVSTLDTSGAVNSIALNVTSADTTKPTINFISPTPGEYCYIKRALDSNKC